MCTGGGGGSVTDRPADPCKEPSGRVGARLPATPKLAGGGGGGRTLLGGPEYSGGSGGGRREPGAEARGGSGTEGGPVALSMVVRPSG
jgi:hypothetical protein